MASIPNDSVDMVVTSPPFYQLRDYHSGEFEIGREESPLEYVAKLRDVFHEVKRVLKPTGTLWLNLGDTYNGNKKGNTEVNKNPELSKVSDAINKKEWKGIPPKSLIGIPWRVAFALQDDGWVLRNDIVWEKVNAMPNSAPDRCSSSHEYLFMFSKEPSGYYFDYEAIEEPAKFDEVIKSKAVAQTESLFGEEEAQATAAPYKTNIKFGGTKYPDSKSGADNTYSGNAWTPKTKGECAVRRKRDVWSIPTKGYSGAHFATFPEKLVEPCILAGCPKGGIVMDVFSGAATTGVVALKNGRRYLGIELNPEYIKLSHERIAKETAQQTFGF